MNHPAANSWGPLASPRESARQDSCHAKQWVPHVAVTNPPNSVSKNVQHSTPALPGGGARASLRLLPWRSSPAPTSASSGVSPSTLTSATATAIVEGLAVHPSGRVALAVGRAGALAMLNLVRGRHSFACRLERPASTVAYAQDRDGGDRFVMAAEEKVGVHDSVDARVIHQMDCGKRVLAMAPAKNGVLYTGGEDRCVTAWDLSSGKVSSRIEGGAHATRVKGVVVFDNQKDRSELSNLIASASSDGIIRIWDVRTVGNGKTTPLAEANTKARLTCLAGTSLK